MIKQISYFWVSSILLMGCATNNSPIVLPHTGYYKQWFNEHKNEQGIIPQDVREQWQTFDQAQTTMDRGGTTVVAKATNLGASASHGGRTRSILVSSLDSTIVLAGAVSGGLWRSTDGGNNWTHLNDQAASLSVTAIVENPFNPKIIYYGTGEARSSVDIPGNGIYKSEDGGLTFKYLSNSKAIKYTNYMAHSVVDPNTIWVGSNAGLYVSNDAGETWKKINVTNLSSPQVCGLISFPDSSIMVTLSGNSRIFKSPKGEKTAFVPITDASFPKSNLGHVLIANCRTVPKTVYAFFTASEYLRQTDRGVFRSLDGGDTWTKQSSDTIRVASAQLSYCQMLGVHPTNPNIIMVGAQNAAFSRNGGIIWTAFDSGHADHHVVCPTGKRSNEVFVGNDGGVFKLNWNTLLLGGKNMNKGYASSQYYAGNYASSGQTCIGGTQDNGSWRYLNGTPSIYGGGDGAYAHISQQETRAVYFSSQEGNTFYRPNIFSEANTVNITPLAVATKKETADFINEYQINYTDGKQLYYKTNVGLWRTKDRGISWERLNNKNITNISAIAVTNATNPTVFVGGSNVFYRIDSAATRAKNGNFTNLNAKLPLALRGNTWGNMTVHPFDNSILFATISSMTTASRVFKARNATSDSIKWEDITGNLPGAMSVYQVQPHPDAPDSILLAATIYGLYFTTNNGKTWQKETRVPNVPILEMKLRASDKTLFLFTHGRGVWHLELAELKNISSDNSPFLLQTKVFPNPTQQMLTITSGDNPIALIQLFSLDGREILRQEQTQQIDVAHLPNGTYLLKVFDDKGRFDMQKIIVQH
jgi:photosystem II stability/assembly factor-like uncharacterized protein